jgi:hypothetical protein
VVENDPPSAALTSTDELLKSYLADRDVPCPQCEYNLRDLQSNLCPECGEKIVLGINLVEPKQAAAITGLIGLAAGAGMNGLLLIYAVIMILIRTFVGQFITPFLLMNGIGLLTLGALLLAWLHKWKQIRAHRRRWMLATGCWLLTLIDLAIFTALIK